MNPIDVPLEQLLKIAADFQARRIPWRFEQLPPEGGEHRVAVENTGNGMRFVAKTPEPGKAVQEFIRLRGT